MKPVKTLMYGLASSAIFAVGAASASTVSIESVSGIWTDASSNAAALDGVGTSTIHWGTPSAAGNGSKSEYQFTGNAAGHVAENSSFKLGTFSHNNNRIDGRSIRNAELTVTLGVSINGGDTMYVQSVFDFLHEETSNKRLNGVPDTSQTCKYGGANGVGVNAKGCADRVEVTTDVASSDPFIVGGHAYVFTFSGFMHDGETLGFFLTEEEKANEAHLKASWQKVEVVPLPAAGWLLIAGLGGLAAV
ncbi:MAG: THxN family PEP-CTERM protein, partial [Dinoroseobacter sp.]|nr:THxN family PEP-CTERM protein [Dinoroseobacter sp.]